MHSFSSICIHLSSLYSATATLGVWREMILIDEVEHTENFMQSMLMGSAVLILAQIILVWVAIVWYRRSSKKKPA